MTKIRLLIVDDSIYMQLALRAMLSERPDIEIVGAASDGEQAVAMAFALKPDLITMDVAMPGLDGVETTRLIMASAPTAIVMLSSLTEKGAAASFAALEAGAVDFIAKSGSAVDVDLRTVAAQLCQKIAFWGRRAAEHDREASLTLPAPRYSDLLILSGGDGSQAFTAELLRARSDQAAPTLVAPNMPANFTAPFVSYLARISGRPVMEADARTKLRPGQICVIPGGRRGSVVKDASGALHVELGRRTEDSDMIASAANAASAPHLIVMSGEAQPTSGWEEAFAKPAACVWVQAPDQCALDGMPRAILTKRMRAAIVEPRAILAALRDPERRTAA